MKYAIFISRWNKDEVKFFNNITDAQTEWEKISSNKHALKTDSGKNIIISNPGLGYLSNLYSKVCYQKSW